MASSEKFLPVATDEDAVTGVPLYHLTGPGSVSYNNSVVDGSVQYSSVGAGSGGVAGSVTGGSSTTGLYVSSGDGDGNDLNNRGGSHLFCNCCCDCRRAVLIVNGVAICIKIFDIIIVGIAGGYLTKNLDSIEADIEDDEFRKEVDEVMKEGGALLLETVLDFMLLLGIGFAACGIYGALKFKKWGIITAGSAYALGLVIGVLSLDFGTLLVSGFMLYPHLIMYKEMKEGIMTELNYHKIAHCCGERNM